MLKLKNVSKFYYNKGVIASGFNKVNLELNIGEFVVITGESGSGKSTLLNVISGLDSYEEGEMYINGLETSHYGKNEMDEYRKKYVSNIFQHFNLVNSYTVYQNIELVLLMNGYKKKDIKDKILELIKQVKLTKYKNTKVSKLSGGQKQRVAIARALAKETPIIVCDEPTANLDSKSSRDVINLLKEISKDKLVIIVTHDFKSVEMIATRVIKMNDGKIVSDKKDSNVSIDNKIELKDNKKNRIGIFNIIRLGIRNTFNIIPKFVLMFLVFLFITASLLTVYGSLMKSEYESSRLGYNMFFNDTSDTRIVIKKKDGTSIKEDDLNKINKLNNVDSIVLNDVIIDEYLWFETGDNTNFYLNGMLRDISSFNGNLDYGKMPESDNEAIVLVPKYEYVFNEMVEDAINKIYYLNGDKGLISIKIVGVKYLDEDIYNDSNKIYVNSNLIDKYMIDINRNYSDTKIKINNQTYDSYNASGYSFNLVVSDKVRIGEAIVSENINYTCKDYDCKNKKLIVDINNLYYKDSIELNISNVYNSKNIDKLLGINKDNINYGSIFINSSDFNKIFNKGSYQASVYADKVVNVDNLSNELENIGYKTLQMRLSLNNDGDSIMQVIKIVKLVVTIFLVITLFFISYFVIKLILKSRNIYFSTLRILGAKVNQVKRILDVELFVNSSLAYFTYIIFILLVSKNIIKIKFIKDAIEYLRLSDYILMYSILIIISYLISSRFSSKLFKNSAMKSYREEV